MSDYDEGYDVGHDDGYKSGVRETTRILTGLIEELRDTAATYPGATGRLLREMAGSAEARLREVQGE